MILSTQTIVSVLFPLCLNPAVPTNLMLSVIGVESENHVFAVGSAGKESYFPETPQEIREVAKLADKYLSENINVDVGLTQVNSWHARKLGLTAADMFDPCKSIRLGSNILTEILGRTCPSGHLSTNCVNSALRQYNTGRTKPSKKGNQYVKRVRCRLSPATCTKRNPLQKKALFASYNKRPIKSNTLIYIKKTVPREQNSLIYATRKKASL